MVDGVNKTFLQLSLIFLVPQLIVVCLTIFRVIYRKRKQFLGWDDYLAIVTLFADVLFYATLWLRIPTEGVLSDDMTQVTIIWMSFPSLILVLWMSRMSIALTVSRTLDPSDPIYKVLLGFVGIFALAAIGLLLHFVLSCQLNSGRMNPFNGLPGDSPDRSARVFCFTDIVGNAAVICLLSRFLWKMPGRRAVKWMLVGGVVLGLIITGGGIVCALGFENILVFDIEDRRKANNIRRGLAHIMAVLSVLMSNFVVPLSYLYTHFRRPRHRYYYDDGESTFSRSSEKRLALDSTSIHSRTSSSSSSSSTASSSILLTTSEEMLSSHFTSFRDSSSRLDFMNPNWQNNVYTWEARDSKIGPIAY
ncbi:hypothetical protein FA15DRAFT_365568 [Coprinopsis marcescibilis]|uniref:Rhodopsin domain-containing protein n=1 Tax=Coprinopsis marcescibilis TaxID=230819 RepID=A0A5C3KAH1_COPMA|nr:hypothetical protein FA15DRAFT_365568 [Coprinopsis marcescibilis]